MKIKKFIIKRFRSITGEYEIPLDNLTVLVGPNNEGKSNILHALTYTLNDIFESIEIGTMYKIEERSRANEKVNFENTNYDWKRDFPLKLQNNIKGKSEFFVVFDLLDKEKHQFKAVTGHKLRGDFGIRVRSGKQDSSIEPFDGNKRIKGIDNTRGFNKIRKFLSKIWDFQYIPAIRTTELALRIVEKMIEKELSKLNENKCYSELIAKIEDLQKPVLEKLSTKLTNNMRQFLPTVQNVKLFSKNEVSKLVRRACKIYVDDGNETQIEMKGDGIKSLMAISILHSNLSNVRVKKQLFLAIEEPESHLHPFAIRRFKQVIEDISKNNQVIITSHCPQFVERIKLNRNIIVNESRAIPAKSIKEIRNILGVEVSDNLVSAKFVLLVEGPEDERIIKSLLMSSDELKQALSNGILIVDNIAGASNLNYKIKEYQNILCNVSCFLDNDESGRGSYEKAKSHNLIRLKDSFFANFPGYQNSEIEDLIDQTLYKQEIENDFRVILNRKEFRNNKKKWSDRVKDAFLAQGKLWNSQVELDVKKKIALIVEKNGINSISKQGKLPITSLIRYLEKEIYQN